MVSFHTRPLERTKTLGERLKKIREEAGLTLEDVESGTDIRRKYLEAIEQGQYSSLPGPIYIENFLKKYAAFLHVSEEFVLDVYRHHEQKVIRKDYRRPFANLPSKALRPVITPKLVKIVIISLVVMVCLGYVGYEIAKIFSPPLLVVASPADKITVTNDSVMVKGTTEPEVSVTVNGQQIFSDGQGNFSEVIMLKEGLNMINISVSKKQSKPTAVQRRVFYEKAAQ